LKFFEACATFTVLLNFISFARRSQVVGYIQEDCQLVVDATPALFSINSGNVVLAGKFMMCEEAFVPRIVKTLEWATLPVGSFPLYLYTPGVSSLGLGNLKSLLSKRI
jgi:hypothetical protein